MSFHEDSILSTRPNLQLQWTSVTFRWCFHILGESINRITLLKTAKMLSKNAKVNEALDKFCQGCFQYWVLSHVHEHFDVLHVIYLELETSGVKMQYLLTGCCVLDIFPQISDGRQSTHICKKNCKKKMRGVSVHVKGKPQYTFIYLHVSFTHIITVTVIKAFEI